ncbi:MAG: hypothetical protein ACRD5M_15820 [Candidatus Acidiferrales bacterium]
MAQTIPLGLQTHSAEQARSVVADSSVPWFVWSGVLAVTSIAFGLYWDISWHMTIGRDTFWTPAHLAIHFGGILAAITCVVLIFSTTFSHDPAAQASSVRVWGFRGPLGAFLTAWGGVTMVTSAPFDNWWHNSFGLDVEILSPPHVVLGIGIWGVGLGCLVLLLARKNRATGAAAHKLEVLFLYLASLLVFLHMILVSEYCDASLMHSPLFYRAVAIGTPTLLVAYGRASGHKWGATIVASAYMALMLAAMWIFPIFPAQPKLGPVYTNVTHMVPMGFPVLLIVPAFFLDLVLNRFAGRGKWFLSLVSGSAFLAALLAAQWPFGNFMISPAARNALFGQIYFPYQMPPSMYQLAYQFQSLAPTRAAFLLGMGIALVASILSVRVGIAFGDWLTRIRR